MNPCKRYSEMGGAWRVSLIMAAVFLLNWNSDRADAQVSTVQEIVSRKSDWKKLAEDGHKLQFQGRFKGRVADAFQLEKLDFYFRLPGSIRLPERMRSGQRLDVTGRFMLDGGKLSFLVSRLLVLATDTEILQERVAEIPADRPEELLKLAKEFAAEADFYADQRLQSEISDLRCRVVLRRKQLADGDPDQLRAVLESAEDLQVPSNLIENIQFEILVREWQVKGSDPVALLNKVKLLDGALQVVPPAPVRLRTSFSRDPVAAYDEAGKEDRQGLHRILYETLRLDEIRQMLKPDGSNGLALADLVRREFPDEKTITAALQEAEVAYQLGRVRTLSRRELQQLTDLLTKLSRTDKIAEVVSLWLRAREQEFGTDSLLGLKRTAEEYLFVGEFRDDAARKSKGVELLKELWMRTSAQSPEEARQIAQQLRTFGWEFFDGRWLTTEQVRMLPGDDIQVAIREGRVVRGMTAEQVSKTLGAPGKISRLGSSRAMREMWIYDAEGSARLVVRFRRVVGTSLDENLVEDVSKVFAASYP